MMMIIIILIIILITTIIIIIILEAYGIKVLRKIIGKTKIDTIKANKSGNPAESYLLMSGWKEEELNGTKL